MPPIVQCDKKEFSGLELLLNKSGKIFLNPGIYIQQQWIIFVVRVMSYGAMNYVSKCIQMHVFGGRSVHFLAFHQSGTLNDDIKEEGKSAWTWFPALAYLNKKQIAEQKEMVLMLKNDYRPVNVEKNPNPTVFQPDGCKMTSRKTALTGNMSLQQRKEKPNRPLLLPSEHEFQRVPSYLAA